MVWQPMPPPAIWPSSSRVERLWGQPAQKPGLRAGGGRLLSAFAGGAGALETQFESC
jgi:hypothetical protein